MPLVRFCMIFYDFLCACSKCSKQTRAKHARRHSAAGLSSPASRQLLKERPGRLRPKPADCDVVTLIWRWHRFLDVFKVRWCFIIFDFRTLTYGSIFSDLFGICMNASITHWVPSPKSYMLQLWLRKRELFSAGDFGVRTPWQTKWLEQVEPCRTCLTHCNLMSSRWWTWSPWIREFY